MELGHPNTRSQISPFSNGRCEEPDLPVWVSAAAGLSGRSRARRRAAPGSHSSWTASIYRPGTSTRPSRVWVKPGTGSSSTVEPTHRGQGALPAATWRSTASIIAGDTDQDRLLLPTYYRFRVSHVTVTWARRAFSEPGACLVSVFFFFSFIVDSVV